MDIAKTIAQLRKEKGLSQEAFAEMIGVSRQSVSKWESGASVPDLDKIIQISKIFGVSIDSLLGMTAKSETGNTNAEPDGEEVSRAYENIVKNEETEKKNFFDGIKEKAITLFVSAKSYVLSAKSDPEKKKRLILFAAAGLCVIGITVGLCLCFGGDSGKVSVWKNKTQPTVSEEPVVYPYILVHGLGGWGDGDGINSAAKYWGATTGDLVGYLSGRGYEVYAPSVGPISSAWDRACELYAQIAGGTVDYGESHSRAHGHSRYGRTYETPIVENWGAATPGGQIYKVNLVGHSFGGATVRLLASLLEYGSDLEKSMTGEDTSPLFTGGKGYYVNSVTTLCAPHNGSTLTSVFEDVGLNIGMSDPVSFVASVCFGFGGLAAPVSGIYDFKLDQFGISNPSGGYSSVENIIAGFFSQGSDNALYDLSPDGAKELNETIKTVGNVYYFSYSYCTTKEGPLLGGQVPVASTLEVLKPTAYAMGKYTGHTPGGIYIGENWQANDGLVSVISAKAPFDEESVEWSGLPQEFRRGVWYVAPTKDGHHGTVIGLGASVGSTRSFYTDLFEMIDKCPRTATD